MNRRHIISDSTRGPLCFEHTRWPSCGRSYRPGSSYFPRIGLLDPQPSLECWVAPLDTSAAMSSASTVAYQSFILCSGPLKVLLNVVFSEKSQSAQHWMYYNSYTNKMYVWMNVLLHPRHINLVSRGDISESICRNSSIQCCYIKLIKCIKCSVLCFKGCELSSEVPFYTFEGDEDDLEHILELRTVSDIYIDSFLDCVFYCFFA